jgi:hypothetical protein
VQSFDVAMHPPAVQTFQTSAELRRREAHPPALRAEKISCGKLAFKNDIKVSQPVDGRS